MKRPLVDRFAAIEGEMLDPEVTCFRSRNAREEAIDWTTINYWEPVRTACGVIRRSLYVMGRNVRAIDCPECRDRVSLRPDGGLQWKGEDE